VAYRITRAQRVERDFKRLPREILERVDARILFLAENPRPRGAKKLTDADDQWSVRVGRDYRILYTVDDSARVVTIASVRHRKDAYRLG
jgi:mRNA interferase RelE/StbE